MNEEDEVKDEVKDETKNEAASEWLEPSPVGDEFMNHARAMEPASRVPTYKAFAIAPGFNVGMLRKMAESYKPKRIVVIDHGENGCEVRRLGNNDDVSLFYASIRQNEENGYNLLQKVIEEYKEFDFKQVECYKAVSEEMKRDGVISYSYLHKRLSKMSTVKNAIEGTTEKIKKLVEEAKTNGILSELPPNLCKEAYETTARLFKML